MTSPIGRRRHGRRLPRRGPRRSRLRQISQRDRNREPLWDKQGAVPSGWARHQAEPTLAGKAMHFFYEKLQYRGGERPGRQDDDEQYRS